jgi:hypothetical protein
MSFTKNVSWLAIFCLLLCALLWGGCGQSSSGSGDSGTFDTTVLNKSKTGTFFASSVTSVASTAASGNTSTPSLRGYAILSGPPSTFFDAISSDGYCTVSGFHASETVSVRLYTVGGDIVNTSYLSGKTLADFTGYNWDDLFGGTGPAGSDIMGWSGSYASVNTLARYIVWSGIAPGLWQQVVTSLPTTPPFSLPTPEAGDMVGSMEARVVISGSGVSGLINMEIGVSSSSDMYCAPVSGAGSGSITIGDVVLSAEAAVGFSAGDPASLYIHGTTNDGSTVAVWCVADGSGTGEVRNTAGSLEATLSIAANGLVTLTYEATGATTSYQW